MTPVLIINTGSSTFKWATFSGEEKHLGGGVEEWRSGDAASRKAQIAAKLRELTPSPRAIGHRVVHGGLLFRDSTPIDGDVRYKLESLAALDPLHMQPALCGIDAAREVFPDAPQLASFDTAFHRTLSEAAAGYALPAEWTQKWSLRRFGFHGLSVAWSVEWMRAHHAPLPSRIIVAHLGSGCSVTAVLGGRSVDTTMGFTPLEGLMMGTRSGSVDPGVLFHLQTRCGVSVAQLEDTLTNKSGLLGVSGISADMRKVRAASDAGDVNAKLAYDRFVLYARRAVGAMAGALGGVDTLVFTGGIGEHDPRVRNDVAAAFGVGLIDEARNNTVDEGVVSPDTSAIEIVTIAAREEVMILRDVLRLSGAPAPRS